MSCNHPCNEDAYTVRPWWQSHPLSPTTNSTGRVGVQSVSLCMHRNYLLSLLLTVPQQQLFCIVQLSVRAISKTLQLARPHDSPSLANEVPWEINLMDH